ncbi:hypothetical protein E2C01_061237 [Portunus trituberculatus]|uniref:Uncharacterized protein n=1 Tax=Portunus trituberculatus TaxID=210409 RepID=A0A5B7HA66_PORTR|nr:hypothetical protein [Portunus trituberculatus]
MLIKHTTTTTTTTVLLDLAASPSPGASRRHAASDIAPSFQFKVSFPGYEQVCNSCRCAVAFRHCLAPVAESPDVAVKTLSGKDTCLEGVNDRNTRLRWLSGFLTWHVCLFVRTSVRHSALFVLRTISRVLIKARLVPQGLPAAATVAAGFVENFDFFPVNLLCPTLSCEDLLYCCQHVYLPLSKCWVFKMVKSS